MITDVFACNENFALWLYLHSTRLAYIFVDKRKTQEIVEYCDDYYIGQTCRPIIKRIKEHEACHRLNNFTDSIGNIKSAPAKHSHDMQHNIDWSNTTILTTAADRHQLNLLEHAAISTYNPPMNRQHKGPRVSLCGRPYLTR